MAYQPTLGWDIASGQPRPNDTLVWSNRSLSWAQFQEPSAVLGDLLTVQADRARDLTVQEDRARVLTVRPGPRRT